MESGESGGFCRVAYVVVCVAGRGSRCMRCDGMVFGVLCMSGYAWPSEETAEDGDIRRYPAGCICPVMRRLACCSLPMIWLRYASPNPPGHESTPMPIDCPAEHPLPQSCQPCHQHHLDCPQSSTIHGIEKPCGRCLNIIRRVRAACAVMRCRGCRHREPACRDIRQRNSGIWPFAVISGFFATCLALASTHTHNGLLC